jgi:membrane-associated protease RseP (regulator of RpoE activity)
VTDHQNGRVSPLAAVAFAVGAFAVGVVLGAIVVAGIAFAAARADSNLFTPANGALEAIESENRALRAEVESLAAERDAAQTADASLALDGSSRDGESSYPSPGGGTATSSEPSLPPPVSESLDRPFLGIEVGSPPAGRPSGPGVVVGAVVGGTGAAAAGLRPGDLIVVAAGRPVESGAELVEIVAEHEVGDSITLVIERAGVELTVEATLGPRPLGSGR